MIAERVLRFAALAIAVLAIVDPVLTRAAIDRPVVVVLAGSAADRSLASQVAGALEATFDVSRTDVSGAAAYVIAGVDLPERWQPPETAAVFAVVPPAPGLRILDIACPSSASIDSVVPVTAELDVAGSGERDVTISLIADAIRVAQVTRRVSGTETRLQVPMTFVPSTPGLARLRVEAAMPGGGVAVADVAVEVNTRVWQVLAFDSRPSYPATFVRRALESDPRFHVTTRVVTSRSSAVQSDAAPASLTDPSALSRFDVIVVGAPDGFGEMEASSLQRYLRERHGAVLLLPEVAKDSLLQALTGEPNWREERIEPIKLASISHGGSSSPEPWAAGEFLWPTELPPMAMPLAVSDPPRSIPSALPAVWQIPVGSGRLIISSATDGWRSRAGAASGFSAFWRARVAEAAQATPPVVSLTLRDRLVRPGQSIDLSVVLFAGGEPVARVIGDGGEVGVRLWPTAALAPGTRREWSAAFRAPAAPGRYRIALATGSADVADADFVVVDDDGVTAPVRPVSGRNGLAASAALAHRGRVMPADELPSLPSQLSSVVPVSGRTAAWRPMRSVWWLAPFTLCAAGEWWLRRRRGER